MPRALADNIRLHGDRPCGAMQLETAIRFARTSRQGLHFFVFRIAEGKGICEAKNSTQRGILSNVHPGREEAFILTIGRSCLFRRGYRTEGKVQIEVVSIPVIVLEG